MDTHDTIKDILSPGDYMASIDLTDAFFSVPIHKDSKRFLCFEFESQRYQFNVLPFGMKSSPRIFTKVLKPVINYLRNQGIKILAYLDDIFLCASSSHILEMQLNQTLQLLISLGFHPNYNKSCLIPSKEIKHLGFVWNTESMKLSLPNEKLDKAKRFANSLIKEKPSLRDLSSFIGLINSFCPSFPLAPLHFRNLQFLLNYYLKISHCWDSKITIDQSSLSELMWWKDYKSSLPSAPIHKPSPEVTLYSDASLSGWGGFIFSDINVSSTWSIDKLLGS